MYGQFGELDLDLDSDLDIPTWPGGPGTLEVVDKYVPLFTSAVWEITVTINGRVFAKSVETDVPHTPEMVKRWTRNLIRQNQGMLALIGVNVEEEYVKWGGSVRDLNA
jgi:hypothetical protein